MTTPKNPLKLKPSSPKLEPSKRYKKWHVLIVDDEQEVHAVTKMILNRINYKGRDIETLSAYSAAEAKEILERDNDIAVILLDVVMETDDAGLKLVRTIREDMQNDMVRIILRTGQPGQAPEEHIIVDYDINDYKSKSELTAQKLFTTVVAGLRSYTTITSLEKNRRGLEKILDSSTSLLQVQSIQQFSSGVLTQLSGFLECQANGIICAEIEATVESEDNHPCGNLRILAATGEYSDCEDSSIDDTCAHIEMVELVKKALVEKKNQITEDYTILFFEAGDHKGSAALLHGGVSTADESDRQLLEVFTSKISIAFANALNYQKMVSSEEAATTDFLTGLNNRRQLIRLGVPLVSGAHRSKTSIAVAMIDIDFFKNVNDTWGHDVGDEVLKRMGNLLKERFRTSDVISRFGGEEFCVIAANLEANVAIELFNDFRQSLEKEVFDIDGETLSITTSIGVCTDVSDNVEAMISEADRLLYLAKENGRNCVKSS